MREVVSGRSPAVAAAEEPARAARPRIQALSIHRSRRSPSRVRALAPTKVSDMLAPTLRLWRHRRRRGAGFGHVAVVTEEQLLQRRWVAHQRTQSGRGESLHQRPEPAGLHLGGDPVVADLDAVDAGQAVEPGGYAVDLGGHL